MDEEMNPHKDKKAIANCLPRRIFVTGTDTEVGKTFISAVIAAGLRSYYWKPIQSGANEGTDTQWIRQATGLPESHFFPEAYRLREPLSPHAAARIEGIEIDCSQLRLPELADNASLIVEGAGGLLVPINRSFLMIDLIEQFSLPVLIVARSGLGTINHTLLTVMALKRRGIPIAGVVMNGEFNSSNRDAIEYYGDVKVLAEIEPLKDITAKSLSETFHRCFKLAPEASFAC